MTGLATPRPKTYQVTSPNQRTRIEIAIDAQKALIYRLWFVNKPVLNWSALGFELNTVAIGANTVVKKRWYGAEFRTTTDPTQVIPTFDLPKVIQYGKEKNIGVILYVNRVALRTRLDEILPLYKKWGVAGLKFGFVDGLSQEGITWLDSSLKKVYDYGLMLDIHDNYKPTGLSRTYPNLLTQEGLLGNENNPDAFPNTVLPFTRFLAGAADYTFCYPKTNRYFTDNLYKSKLQVSGEIKFFKRVPTVWNESHYLAGEISSICLKKASSSTPTSAKP